MSGDTTEDCAVGQPRAPWIVEIEDATDHFAGCIESANWLAADVEDARLLVDLEAPERERDAARDGIGFEGRFIESIGPICLIDTKVASPSAILDRWD